MFVDGLPDDHSMVTAIILMARSLNLQLIAEGVRNQRTRVAGRRESTSRKASLLGPFPRISLEERYSVARKIDYKSLQGRVCASQLKLFNIFVSLL